MPGEPDISFDRTLSVRRALVLAAGAGSRIRSLHGDLPKPLIDVGGSPVLVRNLRMLAAVGVDEIWINLHYRPEQIMSALRALDLYPLLRFSLEDRLLGTAGAAGKLKAALSSDRFFVVYGDNLTSTDLHAMTEAHEASGAVASIAVFDPLRVQNSGIAGGRVTVALDRKVAGFEEGAGSTGLVNAGVYLLEPEVLDSIPEGEPSDFGKDIFPRMLRAGAHLQAFPLSGYCLAFDTPAAEGRARAALEAIELESSGR